LIKNGVSPVPHVFQLTATIARHVLTRVKTPPPPSSSFIIAINLTPKKHDDDDRQHLQFKARLKTQCGVLWSTYARLLDSPNSLPAQKAGALQLISYVCRQPQVYC
jgi:hypothetical protein